MKNICIDKAWEHITKRVLHKKTNLIYDYILNSDDDFPTPEEIKESWPNPCGYGTGIEDSMIYAGTMLDACLLRYELKQDEDSKTIAHRLADGMIRCAKSAYTEGFLPRSVTPLDGKSHYVNSSIDQYTMFVFGVHRYINSSVCSEEEKEELAQIMKGIAKRAERNMTEENNYDMLRDDGGITHATTMWGDKLGNHEYLRLPMIYLVTWEITKDEHWLSLYRDLRNEAYEKSLTMGEYWHLYALQQMQASVRVCFEADADEGWREKIRYLLNVVADYILDMVPEIENNLYGRTNCNIPFFSFREHSMSESIPLKRLGLSNYTPNLGDVSTFFYMQDAANILIVAGLSLDVKITDAATDLFKTAFNMIDFEKHKRALPVHFIDAYYRYLINNKEKF